MSKLNDPIYIPIWLAVIAIVPQMLNTTLGFLNTRRIEKLRREVNGRMTELLSVTKSASHAEGVLQGKEIGKETGKE